MSVSDLLFPNQYRRKVLAWLLMHPQDWVHLRELARLTGASPGTLKKELDALTAAGLLESRKVGNQTQFSANTQHPVYPELSGLIRKTTGLHDVLASGLQPLGEQVEVAFVYGSVASATETTHSDVDVLVIGDASFGQVVNALYDAQTILGREINPKVMTREEWQAKQHEGNTFVAELLKKPKLFLVGTEHDL
ncbi:MAG TPA: nucleotidyltransferase domain-containing protein [Azoarcus taiwanensis]|nr:nucleotidyltransferase domain-containing protein [Azoarcus taiwanensis]